MVPASLAYRSVVAFRVIRRVGFSITGLRDSMGRPAKGVTITIIHALDQERGLPAQTQ